MGGVLERSDFCWNRTPDIAARERSDGYEQRPVTRRQFCSKRAWLSL